MRKSWILAFCQEILRRRLDITWPVSGVRQSFDDVPMNTMIRITEGAPAFDTIKLRRIEIPDKE